MGDLPLPRNCAGAQKYIPSAEGRSPQLLHSESIEASANAGHLETRRGYDAEKDLELPAFGGGARKRNHWRRARAPPCIGRRSAMVAPADTTVLIQGETGSGKEVIARAIHEHSRRSRGPYVKVSCAAIPAGLFESELFGHERGAFTGAWTQTTGRFQMADQGTLFLDEVGDLPLELQPKLLRILQEQEFERLGSARTISVDVRVMAATHVNLAQWCKSGSFAQICTTGLTYSLFQYRLCASAATISRSCLVLRPKIRLQDGQGYRGDS